MADKDRQPTITIRQAGDGFIVSDTSSGAEAFRVEIGAFSNAVDLMAWLSKRYLGHEYVAESTAEAVARLRPQEKLGITQPAYEALAHKALQNALDFRRLRPDAPFPSHLRLQTSDCPLPDDILTII